MKTISRFSLLALAIMVLGLTPFSPSPRRGHRYQPPQIQLPPTLNPIPAQQRSARPDVPGLVVTDLNHGVTATDLVNALVGTGVTISNVTYTGNTRAAGLFTGGAAIIGFDGGIVLDSGSVQTLVDDLPCAGGVEGPNDCYEPVDANSTTFDLPGDSDLTLLSGFPTFDAAVLEFDFVPQFSVVQFQYVFASDEYSDYSNTPFNDVFAFFVNGVNCALVPGTTEPVSVNTINNGNDAGGDPTPHHPEFFIDNVRPTVTIDTQMDGLTPVFTCTANVSPGVSNHMKLAIADASDHVLDASAFLKAQSLVSSTVITTSLIGGGQSGPRITVLPGTVVTDTATLSGPNAAFATGTVNYKVFSDPNCGTLFADAGTKNVSNGQLPNSDPVLFNALGMYYWQASYSGDALNDPSSSACVEETVNVSNQIPSPTPTSTPTPTPTGTPSNVKISGKIFYCSDPLRGPVKDVMLTLTGAMSDSTLSELNGEYEFSSLPSGGSYEVTPNKTALAPGTHGINTIDIVATQRHFLNIGTPLAGCRLTAANVNGDSGVNTIDVVAIQRFYLGQSIGIANVGRYQFTPQSRSYEGIVSNQTDQDYDALIFGDVADPLVEPATGPSRPAAIFGPNTRDIAATITVVTVPRVPADRFATDGNSIVVTTTTLDPKHNLVGFQGDLTFDERVVNFEGNPVENTGLTVGNWNVAGNVLAGPGPIRTLRISGYSTDFKPLSGEGALFGLRINRPSKGTGTTLLLWASPPNNFIFIDADLNTHLPTIATPGGNGFPIPNVRPDALAYTKQ